VVSSSSSIFLSFFSSPNLSRRRLDVCHTSTHGVAFGNFRCRSETCCMRLAANTGRQKTSKICHQGTIAQLCRAISLQLRQGTYRQSEKTFKQQYLLHMSSQYRKLRPTSGWDRSGGWVHSSKFQRVSPIGSVTTTSLNGSQPNVARCLAVSSAGTLHIHFRGLLPHYGILQDVIFTLHPPSLALVFW